MKRILLTFGIILGTGLLFSQEISDSLIETKRTKLQEKIENHPYFKDLQTPQKLPNGKLPPDLYFKEDFLRIMNPETGNADASILQEIRKDVIAGRYSATTAQTPEFLRIPGTTQDPWISRGPYDIGGRTRAIMFDPNDPAGKRVFAGGTSGGLWVNNDISLSSSVWQQVSNYWANNSISCIVSDPNNPQIFYVGTGEVYIGDISGLGIYKTEDGGQTWTHIFNDQFGYAENGLRRGIYFITDIAIRDNNGLSEVFVGVASGYADFYIGNYEAGLYKSVDQGSTFERVQDFFLSDSQLPGLELHYSINRIEIGADNSVWVSTMNDYLAGTSVGGKIFKSLDGQNFQKIYDYNENQENGRVELAVSAQNAEVAYALLSLYEVNNPLKIIKTIDGGINWIELPLPIDSDPGIPNNDFTRGQAFYDLVIAVDPRNHDHVYVGGIDLFRSTNGGETWEQISKWYNWSEAISYVHADQHAIIFNPQNPAEMIFGHDGGVSWASDNSTFVQTNPFVPPIRERNRGYNVTQFYSAKMDPTATSSEEAIMGGTQDNGTIVLAGEPNNQGFVNSFIYTGGDGGQVEFDDEAQYVINGYTYSYHLLTNLNTNNIFNLLPPNQRDFGSFINEIALDPIQDVAFVYRNGISYNVVSGLNGANATLDLGRFAYSISPFGGPITKMATSPFNTSSTTLFVGTSNGRIYKVTNANHQINAAHTQLNTPFVGAISDIHFGPTESHIIVTLSNYNTQSVWYTTDGGFNWSQKEGNLPDMPVRAVFMNPNNENEVILGTDLGVWSTVDFLSVSPVWTTSLNGMSFVKVLEFDYRPTDGTILAATYGRGVFTIPNTFLSTQESASNLTRFMVYPQPSKGTVHLRMEDVEWADVQIFDMAGKLVFSKKKVYSDEGFIAKLPKGVYILKASHPSGFKKSVNLMMR
ncbi:MAG: T9SS type A sorting domain-containing protein [Flavobacteriaceae bacterium]|nr:T9SS type A sorting domain-containing protein [Flavobacteriaceae bacterium]